MKKRWRTPKYKSYMRRKARRSLVAQLQFKEYQRVKRQFEEGIEKQELKLRNRFVHSAIPLVRLLAPSLMSFVRNAEEFSKFVGRLWTLFHNRKPVYVVLRGVEEIDYDGITVLLSVMVRFKAQQIKFNGDFPKNSDARVALIESGFFGHLHSEFTEEEKYHLLSRGSSIHTHAQLLVDSTLGQEIIKSASTKVWGEPRRCPGVQRTLIELMHNTNNHASLEREGEQHWWLSVKHIEGQNRVAFSFVDYGVGVFNSLLNKASGKSFFGVLEQLYNLVIGRSNADVLRLIFHGELHKTASGKTYRGKGLAGIYEAFCENRISSLALITNDVFYNSDTDTYLRLENSFEGTFIYWELCDTNFNLPYVT
jgi:hypothetical protein